MPSRHDLRDRLGDLAGEAGSRARDPGSGAIWMRARARRRRQAGGTALLVIAVTGGIWALGGRLDNFQTEPAGGARPRTTEHAAPTTTTAPPATTRSARPPASTTAPKRSPGQQPGGRPESPVPAGLFEAQVAAGTTGGQAWTFTATSNHALPGIGQVNRCMHVDWPAGTALRCEQAGRLTTGALLTPVGRQAVVGAAPSGADTVRVQLGGGSGVTVRTLAAKGLPGRWYIAFVPAGAQVRGAVALDGGRVVAQTSRVEPTSAMVPSAPGRLPGGDVPPPPPPLPPGGDPRVVVPPPPPPPLPP